MTVEDPLAAHLFSQIEQNVHILASHNYIAQADADDILARLSQSSGQQAAAAPSTMSQLSSKFSKLVSPGQAGGRAVPPPPRPVAAAAPTGQPAKAIWGYNENNEDPKDLTFHAGDIIEIIEETNADWWKGRFNGREGLVPSNYVQKIETPVDAEPASTGKRPYKPFGAVYHGVNNTPPPPGQGVNGVGLQEAPGHEEKKSKFGGLKNTMAHSAAGGVGFGAGAAIGGGLVRAIF
ncbi:hypothetical protein D9611_001492 [Ephemerocybe angulata]|uniref:SH3 domain-containing protein n=1 Tax=Ephemerocybe angulata TaxID=980116 RepID=A0A8H5CIA8_9AGAR|nr:hypothetical protein D9611_001492 [Tulosesus angulatus]